MKDQLNLTDQQWDLLRVLVSGHESNGGAEFYFGCHFGGCGITYPGGISVPGNYSELDLLQLRGERLVNISRPQRNVHRGKPTQLGIETARRHFAKPMEEAIEADREFWRNRREEFESLPPGEYSLIWSTCCPISLDGEWLRSQWSWWQFPDVSLRTRLGAIALKCAKGLHRNSEDGWFDELRTADFVKFKLTGNGRQRQPDGSMVDSQSGPLTDVVKHSITLCHVLEAAGSLKPPDARAQPGVIGPGVDRPRNMTPPSQLEIEKYANEIFAVGVEDRNEEYAKHQAEVLAEARSTNNAGAYLPALIKCKQERLRMEILLLGDAWVEAGTTYAAALGERAHKALEKAAMQMAGGIASALRGELALNAARTRKSRSSAGGEGAINRTMKSALRKAILGLKTQRIKFERGLEQRVTPVELASKPIRRAETDRKATMPGEAAPAANRNTRTFDAKKTSSPWKDTDENVPSSPGSTKREPHPNPETILAGKTRVTYATAAGILGVTKRRVSQLVVEGHLIPVGKGHAKQISTASIRIRLSLPTNSEEGGNKEK